MCTPAVPCDCECCSCSGCLSNFMLSTLSSSSSNNNQEDQSSCESETLDWTSEICESISDDKPKAKDKEEDKQKKHKKVKTKCEPPSYPLSEYRHAFQGKTKVSRPRGKSKRVYHAPAPIDSRPAWNFSTKVTPPHSEETIDSKEEKLKILDMMMEGELDTSSSAFGGSRSSKSVKKITFSLP